MTQASDTIRQRQIRQGLIMVAPAIAILLLVFAYPIGRAFWLSLFTQNLGTQLEATFSGLSNYQRIVGDGRFWLTLWNTTVFTSLSIVTELIIGMSFALILDQAFRGRGLVRTAALLPWALPTAVMGLAWAWIFNDQFGIANDLLTRLGLISTNITWLGDPTRAMLALIFADVWKRPRSLPSCCSRVCNRSPVTSTKPTRSMAHRPGKAFGKSPCRWSPRRW